MKTPRKKGHDEFAVFVVAAAIICVAAILYGIFYLIIHEKDDHGRMSQQQHQSVQVICPQPAWNTGQPPIVNGKG